jgi:hypothetical protein
MAEERRDAPRGNALGRNALPNGAHKNGEDKKEEKQSSPEFSRFVAEVFGIIIAAYFVFNYVLRYSVGGGISWQKVTSDIMSSYVGVIIQRIVIAYVTITNILSLFFLTFMIFGLLRVRQLKGDGIFKSIQRMRNLLLLNIKMNAGKESWFI